MTSHQEEEAQERFFFPSPSPQPPVADASRGALSPSLSSSEPPDDGGGDTAGLAGLLASISALVAGLSASESVADDAAVIQWKLKHAAMKIEDANHAVMDGVAEGGSHARRMSALQNLREHSRALRAIQADFAAAQVKLVPPVDAGAHSRAKGFDTLVAEAAGGGSNPFVYDVDDDETEQRHAERPPPFSPFAALKLPAAAMSASLSPPPFVLPSSVLRAFAPHTPPAPPSAPSSSQSSFDSAVGFAPLVLMSPPARSVSMLAPPPAVPAVAQPDHGAPTSCACVRRHKKISLVLTLLFAALVLFAILWALRHKVFGTVSSKSAAVVGLGSAAGAGEGASSSSTGPASLSPVLASSTAVHIDPPPPATTPTAPPLACAVSSIQFEDDGADGASRWTTWYERDKPYDSVLRFPASAATQLRAHVWLSSAPAAVTYRVNKVQFAIPLDVAPDSDPLSLLHYRTAPVSIVGLSEGVNRIQIDAGCAKTFDAILYLHDDAPSTASSSSTASAPPQLTSSTASNSEPPPVSALSSSTASHAPASTAAASSTAATDSIASSSSSSSGGASSATTASATPPPSVSSTATASET